MPLTRISCLFYTLPWPCRARDRALFVTLSWPCCLHIYTKTALIPIILGVSCLSVFVVNEVVSFLSFFSFLFSRFSTTETLWTVVCFLVFFSCLKCVYHCQEPFAVFSCETSIVQYLWLDDWRQYCLIIYLFKSILTNHPILVCKPIRNGKYLKWMIMQFKIDLALVTRSIHTLYDSSWYGIDIKCADLARTVWFRV